MGQTQISCLSLETPLLGSFIGLSVGDRDEPSGLSHQQTEETAVQPGDSGVI